MNIEKILQKKLLPPTFFIICIVSAIIFNFIKPITIIIYPYNFIGFIFLFIGLYLSLKGSNQFQKAETNINTFDEPDKIIKDGLFKFTRNPMYLGFGIALLGISIILGNLQSFIILIFFILITDQWYIKFEEKMMINKFGKEYIDYKMKTRRWI